MKMRDTNNPLQSTIMLRFESNYLDLEIKSRRETDSIIGHEKRGMALK